MKRYFIRLAAGTILLVAGFVGGRLFQHAKTGFHFKVLAEKQYGSTEDPVRWRYVSESAGMPFLDPGTTIIEYRGRTIYKARRVFQESVPVAANITASDKQIDWDDGELRFHLTVEDVACASKQSEPLSASSKAPSIVIRQYPDYPISGRDSVFAGGLVAALWRDGRMIRPASPDAVGKSYVEGVVSSALRDAFFAFLSGCAAIRAPEGRGIPVDGAAQSITVRRDGAASKWTRVLPDSQSAWQEVESRLLALPMQGSHPIDWAAVRRSSWYD